MKCKECGQEIKEQFQKKWIKLKCSNAEVYPEVLFKNKSWNDIVKEKLIPKNCRIPKIQEADEIDYKQIVNTRSGDNDFFVEQPFRRNIKEYPVARLYAGSGWAFLFCNWDPGGLYSGFGVILVRDIK